MASQVDKFFTEDEAAETAEYQDPAPFSVQEGFDIGDFSDVPSARSLMPVSRGVIGTIRKASIASNKNGDVRRLKLEIGLNDGIVVEGEIKYVGRVLFTGSNQLIVWASKDKSESSDWYRKKAHLSEFKGFATKALGLDINDVAAQLKNEPDTFTSSLIGQQIKFDIKHEEDRELVNGEWKGNGEFREKLANWKKA